ncbi:SRPBCC domain-containing protein [Devosia sp. XJ19-1]|uniref:SRPBCC domain-containing protein n=1 Tax=Devosia ureilytica TaxID=2952754 RepID=A0A9Q4AN42_9HYPH|nr:SRPBCC domain-containing protein [Devosia ureilytica]MCP8883001.1 SRPBCC domain-containing protein [Devosia ureilytica]MCP8886631.1 SRPBCC domain-containing protein [Devosia ureilytica]
MNDQASFTTRFHVTKSPQAAFEAICNPRGWWSGEISGSSHRLGDIFTYRYKNLHFSRQQVSELVPDRRVAWQVLDADLAFVTDRSEWTGTTIAFDIASRGGQTEVTFTHLGLQPQVECFEVCTDAWSGLIQGSLRELIETGKTKMRELDAQTP